MSAHQKIWLRLKYFLFPHREHLFSLQRVVFGAFANAALAVYIFPRREHLFDVQNYRYNDIDTWWTFVTAAAPCIILIVVIPACLSERKLYRYLSYVLSIFPGFLAFFEWVQLLHFL